MRYSQIFFLCLILAGCANMLPPTGGIKDTEAPKLINISHNLESSKKKYKRTILFEFDEYIELNLWEDNFYISPPILNPVEKKIKAKKLIVTINDSLNKNTTYIISLSNSIKDLNEGNIIDSLNYIFSTSEITDSLSISGILKDAYTLENIQNSWVMLFRKNTNDSLILKSVPNYISKTDKNGHFNFPNLNQLDYSIFSLTGTNHYYEIGEKVSFYNNLINAQKDSFITLLAFEEESISKEDTILNSINKNDTINIKKQKMQNGNLSILSSIENNCVFELIQDDIIIKSVSFTSPPFYIYNIIPGKYQLKCIIDSDKDKKWTSGNWKKRKLPEKTNNYPDEIIIRADWDLEIEWGIY